MLCMFLVFVSMRSGLIIASVASLRHNSLKEVVLLFILNIIVQAKKISPSSSLDRDWFIIFWAKVATKWLPGGDEMRELHSFKDIEILISIIIGFDVRMHLFPKIGRM